jgi:septum site-determining protein MinC
VSTNIAIKGTRNGLLLTLQPGIPFSDLFSALSARLAESPTFFRGASLTVDTTHRMLRKNERTQIEELLAHYQMSMTCVETVADARRAGRTITLPLPPTDLDPVLEGNLVKEKEAVPPPQPPFPARPAPSTQALYPARTVQLNQTSQINQSPLPQSVPPSPNPALKESDDTLFLRRTVRSGQAIHHHSNVVVMGDVNPGAEIVAGGDIMVWGVLRGMVHAGYPENENAVVSALQLAPVQLRIAHLLSRPPEGFEAQPSPEVASIQQGQIVVETWVNGRPPRK